MRGVRRQELGEPFGVTGSGVIARARAAGSTSGSAASVASTR